MVVGGFNTTALPEVTRMASRAGESSLANHWTNHGHHPRWSIISPQSSGSAILAALASTGVVHFLLAALLTVTMNRIEDEWLHLKRHELSSEVFEHEYDLALALMDAINKRAKRREYTVERFLFNSG